MSLDLSKLSDAVAKVASLASSHASVVAERDAARANLAQAQTDVDALVAQLLAAASTPAESAGLAAVAAALVAPGPAISVPAAPAAAPVAAPVPNVTYLPGDPRAPKAT